jgi:hypothetical protein
MTKEIAVSIDGSWSKERGMAEGVESLIAAP